MFPLNSTCRVKIAAFEVDLASNPGVHGVSSQHVQIVVYLKAPSTVPGLNHAKALLSVQVWSSKLPKP